MVQRRRVSRWLGFGTNTNADVEQPYAGAISLAGEPLRPGRYVRVGSPRHGRRNRRGESVEDFRSVLSATKFAGEEWGFGVLGIVRAHKGALRVYSKPDWNHVRSVISCIWRSGRRCPAARGRSDGRRNCADRDDEEIVRNTANHTLRVMATMCLGARWSRALEVYHSCRDKVALVLLDMTMPVMSGEEALRLLKLVDPTLKVLLTSGFNEVEAVHRFAGKGLRGFYKAIHRGSAGEKVKGSAHGVIAWSSPVSRRST